MLTLLLISMICLSTSASRSEEKTYIQCSDNSTQKHINFLHPKKELICDNINNINDNDILERDLRKRKYDPEVIQFIYVKGSLHKKLTKYYSSLETVLVYKSEITDFSLRFPHGGQLFVAESVFPSVTTSTFREATDLRHIGFYSNPGLLFQDRCFSDLKHLKNLTIYNQTVPILKYSTLAGLKKLRRLILINNNLTGIENDTFQKSGKLRELVINYNPLEQFAVNLTYLKRLGRLSLINTNLKKLNLPLFFPSPRLDTLGLSNDAWSKIKVVELAQAFPSLRTAVVNKNEEANEKVKRLIEDMRDAGLSVEQIEYPEEIINSIYEEDLKNLAWYY